MYIKMALNWGRLSMVPAGGFTAGPIVYAQFSALSQHLWLPSWAPMSKQLLASLKTYPTPSWNYENPDAKLIYGRLEQLPGPMSRLK